MFLGSLAIFIEEMENNRDVKRVYEEECTGTGGVG